MGEDENNELALIEFRKALELQNKCKKKAFNHFMATLAAQFSGKYDDALKHCNVALKGLSERIMDLLKEFQCNDECKESDNYGEIIKIAEGFMDKMDEDKAKSDDGKELKALIGVMGDLVSKLEEVEEIIKNPNPAPVDDGNSNNNNNESDDPLTKLINGLTSQFGISAADLAKLENVPFGGDTEENNT